MRSLSTIRYRRHRPGDRGYPYCRDGALQVNNVSVTREGSMSRSAIAAFALLALLSSGLRAGETVEYGPPPDWVQLAAVPADTNPSADAPAHSLLKNYQLRITPTTTELFAEMVVHIQTPQGLQALGNIILPWKPDTDVLTVHRFHLLRGKEVIDILGKGQKFEVLRRENNLEFSALDGVLTAALQPDGIEVGDVLDFAFTIRREFRLVPMPEFSISGFVESPPSERIDVRAIWDKSMPIKWRASDITGAKETLNGRTVELRWTASDVGPVDQATDAPVRFWHEPLLEFSTFKTWSGVSQQLAPMYAKASTLPPGSPLRAEAATIAAASKDPGKRLEAALKLAQERVRYVFLGMADGGLRPATADETWQRRFGDCKAKSALLIALLRELDIAADPVAVNTRIGDAIPVHLPSLGPFDHVIVRAQAGGKTYWLDGAGQGSWRLDDMSTPGYRWGLPITARGDALLAMNAPAPTKAQAETDIVIDAHEGLYTNAPFKATQTLRGAQAAVVHSQISQLTPTVREQALRKYWKNEYDFVEPTKVSEDFDANTGVVTFHLEGTAQMDWGGDRYVTDHMRTGSPATYKREVTLNADVPFLVEHPAYRIAHERIVLPAKGEFALKGKNYDATLAGYHYVRAAKIENGVFTGASSMVSQAFEVEAAQARSAQKTLNDMWSDTLKIISTNYAPTDADVAALRARKLDDRANLVWRGNVFLDRGDYDDALKDFDAAAVLEPDNALVLANRGLAKYWLKDYSGARKDLEAALAKEPRNAVALRGLGAVERMTGKPEAAVDHLTASLDAEAGNTFALSNRAFSYAETDAPDKALADAAEAIRINPMYSEMYGLRAWILTTRGHTDLALQELQAMVKQCPEDEWVQWSLAENYGHMQRYPDAVAAIERYIAQHPTAEAFLKRASVRDPQQFKERLADIDVALAKEPGNPAALWARVHVLEDSGDHAGAIAAYTAQLKKTTNIGERAHLTTNRGVQYWLAGNEALARRDFDAVMSDEPDSNTLNEYCWALAVARIELQKALTACDRALKVAPKDPAYLDSRAFVLLQLGRLDESIATYDQALAIAPRLGASIYGRAFAKNLRCKCADSNPDIEKALRLYPGVNRVFESPKSPGK
jgi:tetratricopeptide (TPR) repeat protein